MLNSQFLNSLKPNPKILIRIDDIAENMNWDLMEKCEKLFNKYNIKPVLGVIPQNQDPELFKYPKKNNFWEIIKKWQIQGWEIAMHGYTHVYDKDTFKKDYFGYGGKSEFFGHPVEEQSNRINQGLQIFKDNKINIRSFFAPNHTYDKNTFEALKKAGIFQVIDGYGLSPYSKHNIKFIPQLFYKIFMLPFGVQSTQIHLNYWNEKDFYNFQKFIVKNENKVVDYNHVLKCESNNNFDKNISLLIEKIFKFKRIF